mgnify:CR=1 FL=1
MAKTRMVEIPCEGDINGEPFSYTLTEVDDLEPSLYEGIKHETTDDCSPASVRVDSGA